jgi:hypothetical protein
MEIPIYNQSQFPENAAAMTQISSRTTKRQPTNPNRQTTKPLAQRVGHSFRRFRVSMEITTPAKERTGPARMQSMYRYGP